MSQFNRVPRSPIDLAAPSMRSRIGASTQGKRTTPASAPKGVHRAYVDERRWRLALAGVRATRARTVTR